MKSKIIIYIFLFLFSASEVVSQKLPPINRCRDLWCGYKDRKDRKALIKKANELRGYKEPREPLNIRIRGLINQSESSEKKIQNSSLHFIWNRYGIGFNKLQYQLISENNYEMSHSSLDLSLTFGKDWTIQLGKGYVYSGNGEISFFDSNQISTKKVEGSSNFGVLGIPFSFIEILIGIREDNIIYKEFTSKTNKNKILENDFEIKGKLWIFGLGISF